MKKSYTTLFSILFCFLILAIACRKTPAELSGTDPGQSTSTPPQQLNYNANSPDYGDTIVYPQPSGQHDFVINPVNAASLGKGTYFAWPTGLSLNSATGAINLTQSEAGLRYLVGFVKAGTTDTSVKKLVVAGVGYTDAIYTLNSGDSLAAPYFNGNVSGASECNTGSGNDYGGEGDNKCAFRVSGDNSNSGRSFFSNVKVRSIDGAIDLKATLEAGAFGPVPFNGATVTVPIYYTLNGKTNNATQHIFVKLVYYKYRTDVPANIRSSIASNKSILVGGDDSQIITPRPPVIVVTVYPNP